MSIDIVIFVWLVCLTAVVGYAAINAVSILKTGNENTIQSIKVLARRLDTLEEYIKKLETSASPVRDEYKSYTPSLVVNHLPLALHSAINPSHK